MSRSIIAIALAVCAAALAACASSAVTESADQAVTDDSSGCQALPAAGRRARLLDMLADIDNPIVCGTDDTICPCGSYCGDDLVCHADCLTLDPPGELTCTGGKVCTPLGRCAAATNTPPPRRLALTLVTSPAIVSANTLSGPALVPVTVSVDANSLDFLSDSPPAVVRYSFVGIDDPSLRGASPPAAPGTTPTVKCSDAAPLATSCEIPGGWTFDLGPGNLHSRARTIWVQIPQSATAQSWTLQAHSEWAPSGATSVVQAQPITFPTTDPGHYAGTVTWANPGSAATDQPLALPIEAIVTATHVALFEPTRALLPDGHAVIARSPSKVTMLGWLTTSPGARYDVRIAGGNGLAYDASTGHLGGGLTLTTGTFTTTALALSLQRTGDLDAPACSGAGSCAAGSYCDAVMGRCLPGTGAAPGAGIVSSSSPSAIPSTTLSSPAVTAWSTPLTTVRNANPSTLGGSGVTAFSQPYCYQSLAPGATTFGSDPTPQGPALDLRCKGGSDFAQPTFEYANQQHEVAKDEQSGQDVQLLDTCLTDLGVQPTGEVTAANLLADKKCVSLGRFFLALAPTQTSDLGLQLVTHLLRQWLGLTAYVASTSVQDLDYDNLFDGTSVPAHDRLGSAVDLVEQNLGVLLDPAARAKYASSGALSEAIAAVTPDYRVLHRPVARWTFNGAQTPVPDAEGSAVSFTANGVDLSGANLLAANVASGARLCQSTAPLALGTGRRFTVMANVRFTTASATFTLFEKNNGAGDRLWVEATSLDVNTLALTMRDSAGGVATFPPITRDMQGGWGLLAFVAEDGAYRLHQVSAGATTVATLDATSIVNGGPSWGAAGKLTLACNLPGVLPACTSWDRNVPLDGLDVAFSLPNPRHEVSGVITRSPCTHTCSDDKPPQCTTTCFDTPPGVECHNEGTARDAALRSLLFPNPPASASSNFTVVGHAINPVTDHGETIRYQCDVTISNQPIPVTAIKPVCPGAQMIAWDEVSVWDRSVAPEEIATMAARYGFVANQESLPARSTAALPGTEQAASLAVRMAEAADAYVHLIAAYLESERDAIYPDCAQGLPSAARDRALGRAGKNLRLAAVLADEAASLARAPGATTAAWYPRYQADLQKLAGSRRKAFEALAAVTACVNPLGISEDDLPLYNGDIQSSAQLQFYAGSAYLSGQASFQIAKANGELAATRDAYNRLRASEFQETQAGQNTNDRLNSLRVTYESTLRRLCGAPAADDGPQAEQHLLDGFRSGTLTANNCFLKTETPECQAVTPQTPLTEIPATCLRGLIGESLIAVKSAAVDAANAKSTLDRVTDDYNATVDYCVRVQAQANESLTVLTAHQQFMAGLHKEEGALSVLSNIVGGFVKSFTIESPAGFIGVGIAAESQTIADQRAQDDDQYAAFVVAQKGNADVMACYETARTKRAAIGGASDAILKAAQGASAATLALDNARNEVAAEADEGNGQLSLEATIDRTPPHLHYWLDDSIKTYQRDLSYARRLTYLALRAFEYESQSSIGHRGDVLAARNPDDLAAVITEIGKHNGPLEGSQSFSVGHEPKVLSLRDNILRLDGLATNSTPLPNEPVLDVKAVFQRFLTSEASKIYDRNTHQLLGHGIRFSLIPSSATQCAERIVRITSSIQTSNNGAPADTRLLLYQDNTFSSQPCAADETDPVVSRVQSSHNLLVDDTAASFVDRDSLLSISIDGPANKDATILKELPNNGTFGFAEGFASRGLYGNYILIFPPCTSGSCSGYTDSALATVTDVLFRFDIVFGTKGGAPSLRTTP